MKQKKNTFSMVIKNIELIHGCNPQHLHTWNARMEGDKETTFEGMLRRETVESTADTK